MQFTACGMVSCCSGGLAVRRATNVCPKHVELILKTNKYCYLLHLVVLDFITLPILTMHSQTQITYVILIDFHCKVVARTLLKATFTRTLPILLQIIFYFTTILSLLSITQCFIFTANFMLISIEL
jgi:hypothetical protein